MSWREINLGDAIHIKHGFAFKSQYFDKDGEHIVLTPGNFNEKGGFRLRPGKDRAYVGDIPEGFILSQGDLLVAMTEQGPGLLGSSAFVPESDRFLHNQRLGLVDEIDQTKLEKGFLYFLFNTHSVRGQISGSASGTKVRHTSPERIYHVRARVPDVLTQKKIAGVLSAYDDLIENSRRRMALLEAAARQLYREWFVRLRFPGHEHTSITDGVPEGWTQKAVQDLCAHLSRGISPRYDDEGEYIVINQKCIRNRLLSFGPAKRESKEFKQEKALRHLDVLINSTGTGTLGRVAQCWTNPENCTVDSHVTIARPKQETSPYWFGYALMEIQPILEDMGEGATNQKELSKARIGELKILVPTRSLREQFSEVAAATARQIAILNDQNQRLAQARDLLLPRLMRGELVV